MVQILNETKILSSKKLFNFTAKFQTHNVKAMVKNKKVNIAVTYYYN
jgi:hypothetical protein